MKNRVSRAGSAMVVWMTALTLGACSGNSLGGLGDILGGVGQPSGAQQGQISAEIRQVDANNRTIMVQTADGQTGTVRYDQNTVVVYRDQQHPVTALERGDLVVMTATQDSQGNIFVSRIDVTQSVQDRTGTGSGNQQVREYSGRILSIDHSRGTFTMQQSAGSILVTLPYNPPRATLDYFNRLRAGDNVRLEATVVGGGRVEIYRFL